MTRFSGRLSASWLSGWPREYRSDVTGNAILEAASQHNRSARTITPALDHGVIQSVLSKTKAKEFSPLQPGQPLHGVGVRFLMCDATPMTSVGSMATEADPIVLPYLGHNPAYPGCIGHWVRTEWYFITRTYSLPLPKDQ